MDGEKEDYSESRKKETENGENVEQEASECREMYAGERMRRKWALLRKEEAGIGRKHANKVIHLGSRYHVCHLSCRFL